MIPLLCCFTSRSSPRGLHTRVLPHSFTFYLYMDASGLDVCLLYAYRTSTVTHLRYSPHGSTTLPCLHSPQFLCPHYAVTGYTPHLPVYAHATHRTFHATTLFAVYGLFTFIPHTLVYLPFGLHLDTRFTPPRHTTHLAFHHVCGCTTSTDHVLPFTSHIYSLHTRTTTRTRTPTFHMPCAATCALGRLVSRVGHLFTRCHTVRAHVCGFTHVHGCLRRCIHGLLPHTHYATFLAGLRHDTPRGLHAVYTTPRTVLRVYAPSYMIHSASYYISHVY